MHSGLVNLCPAVNLGNKELGAVVRGSLKLPFDADMGYLGKDKQTSAEKKNTVVDLYLTVKTSSQTLPKRVRFVTEAYLWNIWTYSRWAFTMLSRYEYFEKHYKRENLPEITRPAPNCLVQQALNVISLKNIFHKLEQADQ